MSPAQARDQRDLFLSFWHSVLRFCLQRFSCLCRVAEEKINQHSCRISGALLLLSSSPSSSPSSSSSSVSSSSHHIEIIVVITVIVLIKSSIFLRPFCNRHSPHPCESHYQHNDYVCMINSIVILVVVLPELQISCPVRRP